MLAAGVFGFLGLAAVGGNIHLVHERRLMRAELAALRGEPLSLDADENVTAMAVITQTRREIAHEEKLLVAARDKIAALQKNVPAVEKEHLHSFGRIEEMGQEAATFLPELVKLMAAMRNPTGAKLSEEESARAMETLMAWIDRLEAVGELETNPDEIARLHGATLQIRLGLDGETRVKVEHQLKEEFALLNSRGLARPQRPEAEQEEWYRRRTAMLDEATARIEALIPASQRQKYAVGQSLYLGTGVRSQTTVGSDGHGSVVVGLALPGLGMESNHQPER
jgi:hypothetical protein